MQKTVRAFSALAAIVASFAVGSPVRAQSYNWTGYNGTSGNPGFWGDATQWSTNPLLPTFGPDATLNFGSSPSQLASGYYMTLDTSYTANSLIFSNEWSNWNLGYTSGIVLKLGSSSGNSLSMAVSTALVNPTIVQNGAGSVLMADNGAGIGALSLSTAAPLTFTGTGIGMVNISAPIINGDATNGGITINYNGSALRPFFGGGTVLLSGANSFLGKITLTNGNLSLSSNNTTLPITTPLGNAANPFIVNPGISSLRFVSNGGFNLNTAIPVPNPITLNSTLNVLGFDGFYGLLTGTITGAGGITMQGYQNSTTPTISIQNAATFTGALTIKSLTGGVGNATGTVAVSSNLAALTNGTLATTDIRLFPGAVLLVDNTNVNLANRLNSASVVQSYRGSINLTANATVSATDSIGTLITAGNSLMLMTPKAAAGATLTIGNLIRSQSGTVEFRGNNFGGTIGAVNVGNVVITNNPGGQTPGGTTAGTQNLAVLPYSLVSGTSNAIDLARWESSTGKILPLNRATEYAGIQTLSAPGTSGLNYRTASVASTVSTATVLQGNTTVNGLMMDDVASSSVIGVSIGGPGILNLTGPIVSTSTNGAAGSNYIPGVIANAGVSFGANTGYIATAGQFSGNSLIIASPISGSNGIVKFGGYSATFAGTNSFTGGLTVNSGAVIFASDAALGAAGAGITLNSGSGDGLVFANVPLYRAPVPANVTVARPLTLGPAGGSLSSSTVNTSYNYSGQITGIGNLNITGAAPVTVSNPANNFVGDVYVGGTFTPTSDGALGVPSNRIVMSGFNTIFAPTASYTSTNRDFGLGTDMAVQQSFPQTSSTIVTNGNDFTINGMVTSLPISGGTNSIYPGSSLAKYGPGTLTLTANNPADGLVRIGDRINAQVFSVAPNAASLGGAIRLAGPNGALASVSGFFLNTGASLILDNTAAANSDRLSTAYLSSIGGTIALIGNASANVSEVGGMLSVMGIGTTITLTQPNSGGAGRTTSLTLTNLQAYQQQFGQNFYFDGMNGGTLTVRGTNLGAATGDRTALLFNNSSGVVLIGGIVAGVVTGTSPIAGATDFATTVAVGSQMSLVPFTAYGSLTAPGANVVADQGGGVVTLAADTSLNALRISTGGGVNLGGTTLTLGTTATTYSVDSLTGIITTTGQAAQAGMILSAGGVNAGISNGTIAFGAQSARIITTSDLTLGTAATPVTITGTGAFVKSGNGTLTIYGSATNTLGLSFGTTVSEGTLVLGNAKALATSTVLNVPNVISSVTVAVGAKLDLNNLNVPMAGLSVAGTIALGNGTLTMTGGSGISITGSMTGSTSSTLNVGLPAALFPGNSGNSHQLWGDNSDFKGSIAIYNGSLRMGTPTALGTGTSPVLIGDTSGTQAAALFVTSSVSTISRNFIIQAGSLGIVSINGGSDAIQTFEGSITMNRNLILPGNTGNGVQILAGQISGPGTLQLWPGLNSSNGGAGNYLLTNGANTYTGGTAINAGMNSSTGGGINGIIAVGADTVFSTGTLTVGSFGGLIKAEYGARTIANPILLQQSTTTVATVANIGWGSTGVNDITLSGSVTPFSTIGASPMTLTLTTLNTGAMTFSGVISSGGLPSLGLIKNGPSAVTLSGANTHSGTTVINAGTVRLGNASALGNGGRIATLSNNGGTTVATGAVLDLNSQQSVVEVITLSGGSLVNNGSTRAIVAGGGVSSLSLSSVGGVVSVPPTVSITGGGGTGATAVASLGLTAASFAVTSPGSGYDLRVSTSGIPIPAVTITGAGGANAVVTPRYGTSTASYAITNPGNYASVPTLTFATAPAGGTTATGTVILSGGTSGTVIGINITNPGSGYVTVPSISLTGGTPSPAASFTTINGYAVIAGVNLTATGSGYLTPGTFTFGTNTSYGTPASGTINDTNFGVGVQVTNPGTGYTSAPTVTITGSTATATANLASIILTATSNAGGSGDLQIDSVISGTAFGLNKIGAGALYLNGANTFTGGISVLQGKLSVATVLNGGVASSLGASTNASANLSFADSTTTFEYTGSTAGTDRGMTLSSGSPTILVTSPASTLTLSGVLIGGGGLTASGPGTLLLSGTNTFTGPVTVTGGTLSVATMPAGGNPSPLGQSSAASSNLILNGGTLAYTGATASTDRGFTVGTSGGTVSVATAAANLTMSGGVTGTGSLTKSGNGTLTLTGSGSYSGSTAVNAGTLAYASEAALGAGSVSASPLGTLIVTATTFISKNYPLTGGTVAAATGTTVTLTGATITGGYLAGPGVFATTATTPSSLASMTLLPSATLSINDTTSNFVNITNGGAVNVASGLVSNPTLIGFVNQSAGSLTIGVTTSANVANFQSNGTVTVIASTATTPTQLVNTGTTPLQFGGGSRTFIGNVNTASTSTSAIDLNGKGGIVAGGLLVNNGNVYDSTSSNAQLVADYGARIKGAGYFEVLPATVNGGVFQVGNSPTSSSVRYGVLGGPGYVTATTGTFAGIASNSNSIFQINNATGTAGGGGTGNTGTTVSGWSQVSIGKTTFPVAAGSILWAATPTDKFNLNLQTLTNPTTVGNDVAGLMANFDPHQNYSWSYYKLVNGSTWQGTTDNATLTASTTFTLNSDIPFANDLQGGHFGWNLDLANNSLNLTFTSAVPEPGLLLGFASLIGATLTIRRRKSVGVATHA